MELAKLKKELLALYADGNLKDVLKILGDKLDVEKDVYRRYLDVSRRYNSVQDEKMAGRISFEQGNIAMNRIGDALLNLIHSINLEDIGDIEDVPKQNKIENKIAVFTQEQEKLKVGDFFRQFNFENIEVFSMTEELFNIKDYDLIIFDNQDLPPCSSLNVYQGLPEAAQKAISDRIAKMEQVIQETSRFMVHYGGMLYWVNSHRDRVQAANSRFSLYARTKEVIDFINAYRS